MGRLEVNANTRRAKKPTNILIIILVGSYVLLWAVHYTLVHASAHPRYKDLSGGALNPAFVIMMTEFVKLLISATILLARMLMSKKNGCIDDIQTSQFGPIVTLFKEYLPVAFLYAVANNLMINNLQHYDPTVYIIMSSTRLIMTAVIMRLFMKKDINQMKKVSILIITIGLCIKDPSSSKSVSEATQFHHNTFANLSHLGLLLLQMLCGVLASVYNENLLKNRKNEVNGESKPITSVFAANMCLYTESILLNGFFVLLMRHRSIDLSSFNSDLEILLSSYLRQGIIFTLAIIGVLTSFLICNIDSLSKCVATASTVLFTTVLGYFLFGYQITFRLACSTILVCIGVHSYTFSKDTGDTMTSKGVALSLYGTLKQLWFIPVFFWLCKMIHIFRLMDHGPSPINDSMMDVLSPRIRTGYPANNLKNEQWLDENLHLLGDNHALTHSEWQHYVRIQLSSPLVKALLETKGCRVLEIGSGGGAFSRSLLQLHEGVEILGIDNSTDMVATSMIALEKFPTFSVALASMEDSVSMQKAVATSSLNQPFHLALIMDSLCYLPHTHAVQDTIVNTMKLLQLGGFLVGSIIPQSITNTTRNHCTLAITREWITETGTLLGYDIMDLSSINEDGLYSFILQKTRYDRAEDVGTTVQREIESQAAPDSPAWIIPEGLPDDEGMKARIEDYRTFQETLKYIVMKLEEEGAPVILKWGTALHEFRSGTGKNFVPLFDDKDIDVAVFPRHWELLRKLKHHIRKTYSGKIWADRKNLMLFSMRLRTIKVRDKQIDIYGFRCKLSKNTIFYPWDGVTMRPDTLLPVKHATQISGVHNWSSNHYVYMPSNPECYLENVFGSDFRIPMNTSYHRDNAVDFPSCNKGPSLNATEKLEFMRQLTFCGSCDRADMNHEVIANFSSGMAVTSEVCPD